MSDATLPIAVTTEAAPEETAPACRAILAVNTRARRGEEWFKQAQECLRRNGVTIEAAHALKDPSRLAEIVGEGVERGMPLVIVGGGDGSFRSVVGRLANTDSALGVLPLGTVNDFARNLGIEADIETACHVIAHGKVARIDLGQANDDYFVITASMGFSAQTQRSLSPQLKKLFGPFGYVIASLLALRHLSRLKVTIRGEQTEECMRVVQVGVINGHSWMGGKVEIPGVDLESGRLAFYAVPQQGDLAFLRLLRELMRSRFFQAPGLRAFTTREVVVETAKPEPLVIDGDLCGQTPVRLRVVPDVLKVCVPQEFEGG